MAMEQIGLAARRGVPSRPQCSDDEWPMPTKSEIVVAYLRDTGVTIGWRLKNIGLERLGLWMVHNLHRGPGASA
jgi:hypothetical protein